MIPLISTLTIVVLVADMGTTLFLHLVITSLTLMFPTPYHILTPTFHVTLMLVKYNIIRHANNTDASTSTRLTSFSTSILNVFTKSLAGISYDVTCTKLGMFDLYTLI
ncbi:unnamed protein product [Spirodela intermedia]|uniref:Uncharacterized protein n=1 Tax=Spirodela intermedia TaxID=51605 RepID=A0A7I8J213_SPIIN|nr:unnamed protein product [Spirodela intermedia]CAA6664012.1 unnamed protein product [Spirodela intermedia]CAA6674157.1 unnamed protein product [Spirodela intermedia]